MAQNVKTEKCFLYWGRLMLIKFYLFIYLFTGALVNFSTNVAMMNYVNIKK